MGGTDELKPVVKVETKEQQDLVASEPQKLKKKKSPPPPPSSLPPPTRRPTTPKPTTPISKGKPVRKYRVINGKKVYGKTVYVPPPPKAPKGKHVPPPPPSMAPMRRLLEEIAARS